MKNFVTIILFPIAIGLITGFASCGEPQTEEKDDCGEHPNPYGLDITHCKEDFLAEVEDNPELMLVDLEDYLDGVELDIKYAREDNFTGEVIYTAPKAYVRKPVAEALKQVRDSLFSLGLDFIVYDAYRPYEATVKFFEVYPDPEFLADPQYGSRHNRGCAVDVTLIDGETGEKLPMPTGFDEFIEEAHPEYADLPEEVIENRDLLIGIMDHFGFSVYPTEWWHFDYHRWEDFPLMDLSFEEIEKILEKYVEQPES